MSRVRPALRLIVPALLLLASACSESPTAPPRPQLTPIVTEPRPSIITPFIFPAGAKWAHYFVSFNTNRSLDANVFQYYDGHVGGSGTFVIPGVGVGTLKVTKIEPYGGCVPAARSCTDEHYIPESSIASGVGRIGPFPLTFTLDLRSNLWPAPGPNPGTNYDTASLTICTFRGCRTTTFYGELHHEPT